MKQFLTIITLLVPGLLGAEEWQDTTVYPVKDPATHELLRAVATDDDPVVRTDVLRAFGNIGDERDEPLIRALLADRDSSVRQQAVRVAARLKMTLTDEECDALGHDADDRVRAELFAALPDIKLTGKLPRLETGLADAAVAVRLQAARAAARIAGAGELLKARGAVETDVGVSQAILAALAGVESGPARVALLKQALASRQVVVVGEALRQIGPAEGLELADMVAGLLAHRYPLVQAEAADVVARAGLHNCIPGVIELVQKGDSALRPRACAALGAVGDNAGVPALSRQFVEDADALTRHAAAVALVKIHSDDARQALQDALGHTQPAVRREAAWAMGEWNDSSLAGTVVVLLDDADAGVAMAAAEALGRLKNPEGKSPLRARLAKGPATVQAVVVWALGELRDGEAVPGLIELLTTNEIAAAATFEEIITAQANAAQALGRIGDARALPVLRMILVEMTKYMAPVRQRAVEALQLMRDAEAMKRIMQLLTDKVVPTLVEPVYDDPEVRMAALRYLAAMGDREIGEKILKGLKEVPPPEMRPLLAETLTGLLGRTFVPVPDQSYTDYRISSINMWSPPIIVPLTGVQEK